MLRGLTKKVKVVLAAQGLYNFSLQFLSQYNVLFAQALGASGSDIGLITAISALVMVMTSAYIGLAVEKFSLKKIMVLGVICDTVALTIFALAGDWWTLIPAFILYSQLIRQMPLADIVLITFTEQHRRATLMSLSRILWGGISLFAPLIAAAVVNYYGGINAQGIRPLYYISIPILLLTLLILHNGLDETSLRSNMKKNGALQKKDSILKEYRGFFRGEKHLKRWLVIRLCRDGFMSLLMTFAPLWIVNVKGATPTMLGILSTLSSASAILLQVPAGRLADNIGRKKTFFIFTAFYCLGIITLILAPSPEYLILTSILGMGLGGIGGAALTPLITMWWEGFPTENRGKVYGLEGIITASSRIPTTILGGILWDQGFKAQILLAPVLTELLIVLPLLYTVPETFKKAR